MQIRGYKSVDYVLGSYYFYMQRDPEKAARHLDRSKQLPWFARKTAILLTQVHLQRGDGRSALAALESLEESRVVRDSKLLSQKIKCLHAVGQHRKADTLMKTLGRLGGEFGEYESLMAAKYLREQRYSDALEMVQKAKLAPKANQINLFLETAIKVESGNVDGLSEVCKMAVAVGREDDAKSLQARAALRADDWKRSETEIKKISKLNFFDKLLYVKVLQAKMNAAEINADPLEARKVKEQHGKLLAETRSTILEFDR